MGDRRTAVIRRARVVAWKLLRRLPERTLRRRIGWGDSGPAEGIPPLPAFESRPVRLLIAPHNAAAQGWYWARAARSLPGVSALSLHVDRDDPYATPGDAIVPEPVYLWSRTWQRAAERFVGRRVTHAIVESGWRLFGNGLSGRAIDEVRWLQRRGIAVALLFHGSDIRDPDRHAAAHPSSPFAPGLWDRTPEFRETVHANQQLVAAVDVPIFVSTPDLLDDVPDATWLPVIVDTELWSAPPPFQHDGPVRVAHAPSSSMLKGTDLVEPALQRLHDEGVIDYVRVHEVPFERMPAIFASVDVVLDQFRLGIYGVVPCEAMAAGRLVISHVSETVRERVRAQTGHELPVVEAPADAVESLLRAIAKDPSPWVETAADGPRFVAAVHDGRLSAERLAPFLADR